MDQNSIHRVRRQALGIAHGVGLFLAMLVICLPGIWIVLSSLRPTVEIMAKPPVWIPQELSLDAYVAMFSGIGKGGIPVLEITMTVPGAVDVIRELTRRMGDDALIGAGTVLDVDSAIECVETLTLG